MKKSYVLAEPDTAILPITGHIRALRKCLIQMLGFVMLLVLGLLPFHKTIYEWISQPLIEQLPNQSQMIATTVTGTFVAPLQLILFVSVLISLPILVYCLWNFIKPGLKHIERRLVLPLFLCAIGLFYLGASGAYYFVLPTALHFFMSISPDSVLPMTDIQSYLQFCLSLFFIFGMIFEIPILIFLLSINQIVSVHVWKQQRRLVIVGCFFVAMFITPPDALSMIMLAVPMYLLFEIGLAVSQLYLNTKRIEIN
ncbi:MAG: twin arginine-targeting protein translocase TatC [Pseudomonadales bacterium RIFCSPHIGHO2_12_FULL_40_16]|jgi:sec-independent protein translocase protein TatC|uniref:Sec-independent protein translocase protein TatC n=3 Tax=Acinetobacter TaxID=469 RepID=N9C5K0_9GAMM|nr:MULTISPECIES: twin-arginine translocase subunit TatC [Acinetobacter]OHC21587.1 MAG: twin arginine-targeting protein translocase TatC [Pseudomonadales bacterium RIFCSPHIGHO2_12_FULL_40_16]ENU87774.1 twin arginine-targeting protein translocase TatC [Acinetobacter sp. CIP 102529]ENU87799.1 twin arginine-targeting protein translocase TatC [Acinetobacter sp. CIP 102529]ENV80791.1 twin arginine-targeting protein translocase TatC [Acinetobacter ursingii ANC 3649]MCU4394535.1 twin-arginine transloc